MERGERGRAEVERLTPEATARYLVKWTRPFCCIRSAIVRARSGIGGVGRGGTNDVALVPGDTLAAVAVPVRGRKLRELAREDVGRFVLEEREGVVGVS